jgi:CubicO group peptidase (beta-lactamase class C family)
MMSLSRVSICFIFSLISITNIYGQSSQDDRLAGDLDSLIPSRLPKIAPGCVVLVAKKGMVLYKKAFGLANIELQVSMQPDMIFRIGSITKQYTAIAILQLVEQGKISLQDSLQKFINDFPYKGHTITIENLLTHTSGIVDYEGMNFPIPTAIRVDFPPKLIIDSLGKLPLDFVPGTKFQYSNSNYFLLAYIIGQVSGQSYQNYLADHLFNPAGLHNTYYDSPEVIIPNRVSGYARDNSGYSNAGYISMTQVYGAGALASNVEDMFKWHQALYNHTLVKKETLDKAFTPYKLSNGDTTEYGYGWIIKDRNGYPSIEHSGGIDGFQSDEIYFPRQDIFIATLYNALINGGDDMSFMGLDNDIATLSVGKQLDREIRADTNVLAQYVGVYEDSKKHPVLITIENGQLQMAAPDGGLPKSPLFPKSDSTFFLKVLPVEVEFVKDHDKISQLVIHYKRQIQVVKKVR